MTILLLKGYNNYFNRIVKKESTITDYKTASTSYLEYGNVNFVPNDGVVTSLVVGGDTQKKTETVGGQEVEKILDFESGGSPDYLIVHDNVTISSRWFVTECVRVRAGQYQLTLKRDVLVDFYDDVKVSPTFIEKATVTSLSDPLLYNSEHFEVNQIKTSENLIKDETGVAWIVGYISSKMSTETKDVEVTNIPLNNLGQASGSLVYMVSHGFVKLYITYGGTDIYGNEDSQNRFTYTYSPASGIITYSIANSDWANKTVALHALYTEIGTISSDTYKMTPPGDESRLHLTDAPYDMFCIPYGSVHLQSANIDTVKEAALEIAFEFAKDLGKEALYDIQLLPYCPRRDMIGTGKIYEVLGVNGYDYNYIYKLSDNSIKSIVLWCTKSTDGFTAAADNRMEVPRKTDPVLKTKSITSTNARVITISDYSKVSFTDDTIKNLGNVTVTGISVSKDSYNASSSGIRSFEYNENTGYIMGEIYTQFPTGTSTGWNATITFTYNDYVNPKYLDYKISNECDVYRLTSPNYNGQFEWSIAKGTGEATFFNVDFTYKPFQPYIHVMPNFANLYGQDFDDARGLICGGDFSMPIITDAWTEYQVQNKTYQEMFDRQIQNMDALNVIQGSQQAIQGGIGIITGSFAGAAGGAKIGGPYGAAAGALVGGVASTAGMIADQYYLNKTQAENRSFAIDMFNYGLQNVKALPYSLSKVSAYNANNKIFPMVEYFTCSDREKQAFKDKLKYNGMTINVIGKIEDFITSGEKRFIKGQIIRLENIDDDSHIADEIYNEINKGVFM